MSNPNPGAAVVIAAFSLFGAFTAIAWSEDIKRDQVSQLQPPEHVCHRLAYELDQQEAQKMSGVEAIVAYFG